jgi:dTDP-4-amino-4,6-dideoxygalactose transaminase
MSPVPFLDLKRQYREIQGEIDDAIRSVILDTAFVGGARIAEFEESFADFVHAEHCVGVANGTDALEIALEVTCPDEGGEVVVPANSFIATSEAASRSGLQVVFADVDTRTYVLDPDDVRRRITPRTRAIVAVHLYGHPAPMDELGAIAADHGLVLIEDAAQAHGSELGARRIGSIGTVATFSFYPGKNLGAYGDAGAITTNDPDLARKMRMLANHGRLAKYDHAFEGRNSRLDGLQAAVLTVKLRHLEEWTERRRELAALYRSRLADVGDLVLPVEAPGARHVYHLFVVRTESRDALRRWLKERGVSTGVHYPVALPRLGAYSEHPQHHEGFRSVPMSDRLLSLPMGDSIRKDEVERVSALIIEFFSQ